MNIKTGDRFFAYSVGEHIVDPDTGLKLGAEEKPAGTIEVRDVKDKFSIANLISGRGALKRGDVIKEGVDIQRFDVPDIARSHFNRAQALFKEKDYAEAEKAYRTRQAGDTVSLKIIRDRKPETVTVTLGLRPN